MKVKIEHEAGYTLALKYMAYSFKDRAVEPDEWWDTHKFDRAVKRSVALAPLGAGHNKFLRQITLYVDIEAPRCWWSEFDTYKVGTVANSESTMHTLAKRPPEASDFEPGTHPAVIETFRNLWGELKSDVTALKLALPEGYLQRRGVTMNYATLRTIIEQRQGHRLRQWGEFIAQIVPQLEHPELLVGVLKDGD